MKVAQVLRERLGAEGADAVVEALDNWMSDERRDLISCADEKVAARYESIHRRVHEDIAGVGIRLTKALADYREENLKHLAAWKDGILKWFLGAVFLNAGVTALTALAFQALMR